MENWSIIYSFVCKFMCMHVSPDLFACYLQVEPNATIGEIKSMFHKSRECHLSAGVQNLINKIYDHANPLNITVNMEKLIQCPVFSLPDPQWYPARQSIRLDPKGKSLKDEDVLQNLPVGTTATFYFRDLGAQISWVTVFLTEYTGPLLIYLMFYFRVPFIYAPKYDFTTSKHWVVHLACMCHSFHYVKRLLETLFVHRFSHGTMPLRNIFKNCSYYWGFAAWMAYYINHPLYTPPIYGEQQIRLALIIFLFCQIGNFSIHIALRNLRPPGSKTRKIPYPTKNPFTWIFLLVSCPNYTYELGSWLGFTLMTQCVPVAFFTLVGFIQMTVWAKGKHRSYLKEFRDYPPLRSPILPFIL
uniref:Trans-2,3-enoyl-CoA reductase b n=1 Tax=Myripristis murdjan TaxID=586833 RepID=A0A667WNL2_9TELE